VSSDFLRPPSVADDASREGPRSGLWRWPVAPAVFNLDVPARYVHWHFFQMSVANIVVIVLMIVVFVAAILLPFPNRARQP
jgi:hypothetical protein